MIKAFAALEGVCIDRIESDVLYHPGEYGCMKPYNPMADPSLSIDAIMKYQVDIDHSISFVSIASDYTDKQPISSVYFDEDETLGHAIIECILKSTGKWV